MYSHNIQVSVMCPGPVFTGLLENAFTGSIANVSRAKFFLYVLI